MLAVDSGCLITQPSWLRLILVKTSLCLGKRPAHSPHQRQSQLRLSLWCRLLIAPGIFNSIWMDWQQHHVPSTLDCPVIYLCCPHSSVGFWFCHITPAGNGSDQPGWFIAAQRFANERLRWLLQQDRWQTLFFSGSSAFTWDEGASKVCVTLAKSSCGSPHMFLPGKSDGTTGTMGAGRQLLRTERWCHPGWSRAAKVFVSRLWFS